MTLTVNGLSKRFAATQALDRVSLQVRAGEVLALVGENGAGKSTLIKILAGIYQADEGEVWLAGAPVRFASPADSLAAGVVVIPQELRVVPNLSVAENVLLGHLPVRRHAGFLPSLDRAGMRRRAKELLTDIGVDLDIDAPVGRFAFAEQQLVVVARALGHRAKVLILDEPTAALESREVQRLFDVIRRLRDQSVAVIYISHRLSEINELADRCIVLRDGRIAAHFEGPPFSSDALAQAMSGHALTQCQRSTGCAGSPRLRVPVADADLVCHQGESIGLAGLLGSGAKQLLREIFGATARAPSRRGNAGSPRQAISTGIGFVPGERAQALVMSMSVRDNIVLPHLAAFRSAFGPDDRAIDAAVAKLMELLDVRPRHPRLAVGKLSGGNQQKVAFAKWLVGGIDVLLLDEPTHGIDIAAKALLHERISAFVADSGTCVLSSSDTAELFALSDKIVVMRRGRMSGQMTRGPGFDESRVRELLEVGA